VVRVSLADRSYDIRIRSGSLNEIGPSLRTLGLAGKAAIVTNPLVGRLYAGRVRRSLDEAGFEVLTVTVPEGERSKTLHWTSVILDRLARARFERGSVLVALGGGVIGDLTGFAAAIYLRGIPFVQVPTTLVAQVDSSVGGKTGVNHPLGKNLIGAFYQPRLVLIDPDTLKTLPKRERVAGLAEVIKYGVIQDAELFAFLETNMLRLLRLEEEPVVHVIARSCGIKAGVVAQDEREADLRRILNYGHTFGHALEALGRYRTLIHGEAVAIGMALEAELGWHLGFCEPDVVTRQRALVQAAGLPDTPPRITGARLWSAMQHDKKVAGGRIHCVLPKQIGQVIVTPVERSAFDAWYARSGAKGKRRS
jgi:3-dehydroquinate synthase